MTDLTEKEKQLSYQIALILILGNIFPMVIHIAVILMMGVVNTGRGRKRGK